MNPILLLEVLASFLKIGSFSFGGGYAILAFISKELVEKNGWLSPDVFIDVIAIAEITPGPIAVDSSSFVGYILFSEAGVFWGVLAGVLCTVAVIFVPVVLSTTAAIFMDKFKNNPHLKNALSGIRPAVIGLIAASCYGIAKLSFVDFFSLFIFGSIFLLTLKCKLNPILALLIAAGLGVLGYGFLLPLLPFA